jgi:succinate dehydrogenase/fumarate reductase cytochrome b subunit
MVCYITCALAVAFIVASVYIMITKNDSKDYENLFDKDVVDRIVKQRFKIYFIASIIGVILGIVYIIWKKGKITTFPLICTAILIFFVTQMIVYMVYPKSDYLLNYVTNNEQSKAWLKVYQQMMKKFLVGFLIGLVGYGLLCWAILK